MPLVLIKFSTSLFQTVRIWRRWNRLSYFTSIILLIYCLVVISYRYLYDTVFNTAVSVIYVLRNINWIILCVLLQQILNINYN
jgi:hypothetical protein